MPPALFTVSCQRSYVSLNRLASRLNMPLSDSATPTLNSFACPSAARRPSHELPGNASVTIATNPTVSHRAVLRLVVMPVLPLFDSVVQQGLALPAVQGDERAVHEARTVGGDEDRHVRHLFRRADAPERNAALRALLRGVHAD